MESANKELAVSQIVHKLTNKITWSAISTESFSEKRSWLSKKIFGSYTGANPTNFSSEERQTLKNALKELASDINEAAEKL